MNEKQPLKNRIISSLFVMFFPAITFFILSPLEIYAGNQSEFLFGYKDFIWSFVLTAVAILLVGGLILTFLPEKVSRITKLIVFAGTFTAYIQNMFLNKELISKDGSKLDWGAYSGYTKINAVMWFVIFAIIVTMPLWLKKVWPKVIDYVSAAVSAIQVFAIASLIFTLPYSVANDNVVALTGEGELSLAPNSNVIVLVLDRYANTTFENGPTADPDFYGIYSDFTYYDNYNSSYNFTFPSMVYMMTHVTPDCDMSTKEYKMSAWDEGLSKDFHEKLANAGYVYNFYTQSGRHVFYDAACLEGSIDNITKVSSDEVIVDKASIYNLFIRMTAYKYCPYVLKPYLETQSIEFNSLVLYEGVPYCHEDNSAYYENLLDKGLYINNDLNNAFIIQQLSGMHTPYTIAADGSRCEENETERTACQLGINVILEEYFKQLKELGIYDSSTIIIMSDHGLGFEMYYPQPIFLIKTAGEHHENMQVTKAPVSSEDFLSTILTVANIEYDKDEYGTSVFDWNEGDERERFCAYPSNGFNVYTYTGRCGDLVHKMEDGEYTRIEGSKDWD